MSDLWILGTNDEEEQPAPERRRDRKGRGRRRRRRRGRGAFAMIFALLVIAGLGTGGYLGGRAALDRLRSTPDYTGDGDGEVTIQIEEGDTSAQIGAKLVEADVVKSEKAFNESAAADSRILSIQPGFYTLRHHMSAQAAVALLLDPAARAGHVTVPEGQIAKDTIALLAEGTGIPADDFNAVLADPSGIGLPDYAHGKVEGFLYPATYDFPTDATATDVLSTMVDTFKTNADTDELAADAQAIGYSPYQVLIVASLLEKEGITDDFGKIARVIYNRLDQGMTLDLDSTINYGLGTNELAVDTDADTLYNTYQHDGLTPTPISNPGDDAITAALHPESGEWLYFVKANEDGHSAFAVTLEEHRDNVDRAIADGVF